MRILGWVGLFVLLTSVAACGGTQTPSTPEHTAAAPTTQAPTTPAPTAATPTRAAGGLTLDDYNKLMTGMTEAEVTAITGPCETTSETNIAGHTSKTLECKGSEPFSSALLIFANGKLESKSQFGLSSSSTEVKGNMTLAKYNQLQIGKTSAEVQAITGPCEKSSEVSIGGDESFALTCYASDGLGNALLLFSSDKLQSKSQFGLR